MKFANQISRATDDESSQERKAANKTHLANANKSREPFAFWASKEKHPFWLATRVPLIVDSGG